MTVDQATGLIIVLSALGTLVICFQQYVIWRLEKSLQHERDRMAAYVSMRGVPAIVDPRAPPISTFLNAGDTITIDIRNFVGDQVSLITDAPCRLKMVL